MKEIRKFTQEINENIPNLSEKIAASVDWEGIKESCVDPSRAAAKKRGLAETADKSTGIKRNKSDKKRFYGNFTRGKKAIFAFAACVLVLVVSIPLSLKFFNKSDVPYVSAEEYDLVIDVNPSIMFSVDKNDKVLKQSGLNEDGVLLLYNKKFVGMTADDATRAVTEEMKSLGLIKVGGVVRISAVKRNTKIIYEEKQSHIESVINSVLSADVTTVFLSDDELDRLEDYYKNNDISAKESELTNGLKNKVKELIAAKTSDIQTLLSALGKYLSKDYKKNDAVNLSDADRMLISAYCEKYGVAAEFDVNGSVTRDDIEEFIDDLNDAIEDLTEALEDIEEADDDNFGETLKDLIEIVKEEIFNKEDD